MTLQESLTHRYNLQQEKLKLLLDVNLQFQEIDLSVFPAEDTLGKYLDKYKINEGLPVVYYFEIKKGDNVTIWNALYDFKKTKVRSCPRIKKPGLLCTTNTLYVGSVKWAFKNRIKQHFGFGHPGTFALQLSHWIKSLDLHLVLHYCTLEKHQIAIIRDVEAAISENLRPLVGKREE